MDLARTVVFVLVLVSTLSLAGCSSQGAMTKAEDNLRRIGIFYGRFLGEFRGKAPASEAQFKDFIKKIEPTADIEQLFISPRDKQPYIVNFGLKGAGAVDATKGAAIIAREKEGVGGKIQVVRSTSQVEEVAAASLK